MDVLARMTAAIEAVETVSPAGRVAEIGGATIGVAGLSGRAGLSSIRAPFADWRICVEFALIFGRPGR